MIYLLEDDNSIREFVIYTLNSQGLEAQGFERPSAFWEALEQRIPSLVLLDIMLPEEDGLSVLKRLRGASSTRRIPIIMLTAKSTEFDKVLGLDSGADDDIPKPFGMIKAFSCAARRKNASSGITRSAACMSAPPNTLCAWMGRM